MTTAHQKSLSADLQALPKTKAEDAEHRFTQGECHVFALALHRYLGWPILLCLDHSEPYWMNDGDPDDFIPVVCHAFAVDPDGNAWDIHGVRPKAHIEAYLEPWVHVGELDLTQVDESELQAYVDTPDSAVDRPLAPYKESDIEQAWFAAKQSLSHLLSFYDALVNSATADLLREWVGPIQCARPQALRSVSMFADQYPAGSAGHSDPALLDWFEIEGYPICRIVDAVDAQWFEEERRIWAQEGEPDRFDDMLLEPIRMPVFIFDDGDGGWLWDGNHRVGAARHKGQQTIRALVGVKPVPHTQDERKGAQPRPRCL